MNTVNKKSSPKQNRWQLQEAKNRLSQVVDQAVKEGPQTITLRGKPAVVVISADEFRRLEATRTPLVEFFRHSPLCAVELDLERRKDLPRETEL
jgi:prevent-host-death family protein